VFPPLAGSEWVQGKDGTALAIVLQGVSGEMQVAGKAYNGAMPGFKAQLDDVQVAALVSHLRSSWGHQAKPVTPARVAEVRRSLGERSHPFDGQRELERLP
jgi:mono/diheme cytochrome c family protein